MTSVAFARAPVAPGAGMQDKITSSANGDYSAAVEKNSGDAPSHGPGAGKARFRHIDDLVSVSVDIDPHTPLRKILEIGDAHMRQAMTYNDFRRPDLALQEYIKAFTIAVDKVPRHKDYPSMKSDRGNLSRLYNSLKTKITTHGTTFDKIKEDIKEDNRQSGVQPTTSSVRRSEPPLNHGDGALGPQNAGLQTKLDSPRGVNVASIVKGNPGTGVKPKPAVLPKPQALHGKTIRQASQATPEDLTDRFARLRGFGKPEELGGPTGKSQPLPLVDKSTSAMPELPKAIYNPARGTVTSEVANLPSSNPRGLFSRTNSIASVSSCSSQMSPANALNTSVGERFGAAHTYRPHQQPTAPNGARIPEGDTITAQSLANLMQQRSPEMSILLIDVRSREAFDEGHIKSSKTICVEPEILMRENISADEIADSMVLSPPNERFAFEQRDRVDLVVIYDEDSTTVPARITGNFLEMILYNLRQALSYYSYNRPLKESPKLLKGGLSSWVDEFGERSLETSDTVSNPSQKEREGQRPRSSVENRGQRRRAKTRILNQDEVDRFEDIIREDQAGTATFDYIRTREDFIRRYPSVSNAAESMISPIKEHSLSSREADFLASIAPTPPTRPAPAMPKTRYSGLESRVDDVGVSGTGMLAVANTQKRAPRTGLLNQNGATCYANSSIQAWLASPGFVEEMLKDEWPEPAQPGRPQLMSKILKNLFTWLEKRQLPALLPTTLMDYCYSIHAGNMVGNQLLRLGSDQQQDPDEFIIFVLDEIAGETNRTPKLNSRSWPQPPDGTPEVVSKLVSDFWHIMYSRSFFNFADKHFGMITAGTRKCRACGHIWTLPDSRRRMDIKPPDFSQRDSVELRRSLLDEFENKIQLKVRCPVCRHDHADSRDRIVRLPPLLRFNCARTSIQGASQEVKSFYPVDCPFELDLKRMVFDEATRELASEIVGPEHNDGLAGPTKYDLYAAIAHLGRASTSGHYIAFVFGADRRRAIRCDDATIKEVASEDALRNLRQYSDWTVASLFYKRRDIPFREL